jgi:hypothetical protein
MFSLQIIINMQVDAKTAVNHNKGSNSINV